MISGWCLVCPICRWYLCMHNICAEQVADAATEWRQLGSSSPDLLRCSRRVGSIFGSGRSASRCPLSVTEPKIAGVSGSCPYTRRYCTSGLIQLCWRQCFWVHRARRQEPAGIYDERTPFTLANLAGLRAASEPARLSVTQTQPKMDHAAANDQHLQPPILAKRPSHETAVQRTSSLHLSVLPSACFSQVPCQYRNIPPTK